MAEKTKTFYELQIRLFAENNPLQEYQYVQVRNSRAFMEKHLAEKITLDELAAEAFMSRFHFIRIFQKIYGMTPGHYLRDLRISKAKEFLKSDIPVTQVCFDTGYNSLSTFSNTFKCGTGFSPKKYQLMYKSNLK